MQLASEFPLSYEEAVVLADVLVKKPRFQSSNFGGSRSGRQNFALLPACSILQPRHESTPS